MRVRLVLSFTYLLLTVALIELASCRHKNNAQECFRIEDCGDDRICFLGTCQKQGYSIQQVYAELTPPDTTDFLRQQPSDALELSAGYQEIYLSPTIIIQGLVKSLDTLYAGTLIAKKLETLTSHDIIQRVAVDAETGYKLAAVSGNYDMKFIPYQNEEQQSGRPPISYNKMTIFENANVDLAYPNTADLLIVNGRIFYSVTDNLAMSQAYVSASATDNEGDILNSSTAITNEAGEYSLVFPPGATNFEVTVHPYDNLYVPETTFNVSYNESNNRLDDINLGVAMTLFNATVRGIDDTILPETVVFFYSKNIGKNNGTFLLQLTTDEQGNLNQASLLPGDYTITVVPPKTGAYAVTSTTAKITTEGTNDIALIAIKKVRFSGMIYTNQKIPLAAAHISLTLRDVPTARYYDIDSNDSGSFYLDIDPGDYDLVVQPPVGVPLPRYRVLKSVSDKDKYIDINLYNPVFVYGRVLSPDGIPIAGVSIDLYATELGVDLIPMLVGLGVTGSKGEFVIPVPIPND
ncbi:MAG: hypothetical protein JW841_04435 [Deltaproteobacteria bacterium]|nr:hypothetical protein [Deltaproteobacteria bacterium]